MDNIHMNMSANDIPDLSTCALGIGWWLCDAFVVQLSCASDYPLQKKKENKWKDIREIIIKHNKDKTGGI